MRKLPDKPRGQRLSFAGLAAHLSGHEHSTRYAKAWTRAACSKCWAAVRSAPSFTIALKGGSGYRSWGFREGNAVMCLTMVPSSFLVDHTWPHSSHR
jgi:hypothetical protein